MRFLDALKMALHNIWHNKSRTALTVIIVLIVGTLLMVLNIFAISFYNNMNSVSKVIFNEKGTSYRFSAYYERSSDGYSNAERFSKSELEIFFNSIDTYSAYVDSVEINGYFDGKFSEDLSIADMTRAELNALDFYSKGFTVNLSQKVTSYVIPLSGETGFLLEGRPWTKKDRGTNNIWITDAFAEEVFKEQNLTLRAGDELIYMHSVYTENKSGISQSTNYAEKMTICGIIDSTKIKQTSNSYWNQTGGFYVDAEFLLAKISLSNINDISMNYLPGADDYDFISTYNNILAFENSINNAPEMRQGESDFLSSLMGGNKRMYSEITSQMSQTRLMGGIIIVLILAISLVIILLSAGSIANSIIISTDKNKKFIGLMKALGLKNKGVNNIINLEAVIQIFIGVAVSFLVLNIVQGLMLDVLTLALGSIFRMIAGNIEYSLVLYMPIYIPIAVFLIFLAFALLSARGSLKKLGKMDVIAIMSEAA